MSGIFGTLTTLDSRHVFDVSIDACLRAMLSMKSFLKSRRIVQHHEAPYWEEYQAELASSCRDLFPFERFSLE